MPFTRLPDGDVYAPEVGFSDGFPVARSATLQRSWLTHCYGMVGVGRDLDVRSGSGAECHKLGIDLFLAVRVTGTERVDVEHGVAMQADGPVPAVRIEYCVSCGFLGRAASLAENVLHDFAEQLPGGVTVVLPGREAAFLAPFPVRRLPGVGGRRLALPVDAKAPLVLPSQYVKVGQSPPRPEVPAKCTGRYQYIQDFSVPGMLHGRVIRPPKYGATIASVDSSAAEYDRLCEIGFLVASDRASQPVWYSCDVLEPPTDLVPVRARRDLISTGLAGDLIVNPALQHFGREGPPGSMRGRLKLRNQFHPGRSWLWIQEDDLRAPRMYSYSSERGIDLSCLVAAEPAPPTLDEATRHRLWAADVLTPASAVTRARREFAKAVQLAPADDYAHFALALACERTGQRDRARGHVKLAVTLRPGNGEYERALRRIAG
jgi:hypothetical protein